MSDNFSEEESCDNLELSEVKLTVPELCNLDKIWTVFAKNRKVNKSWENLMQRSLRNTIHCYEAIPLF
jgi:hypothetical protein